MVERKLYMDKISSFINQDIIKVITGIRRCGKSYFFKLIIDELKEMGVNEENILLIDLELPEYNMIKSNSQLDEIVLEYLNSHEDKVYMFFDEIQNVEDWQISINSYFKLPNVEIFITGSNSKLLSSELSTYLTGRYVSIDMYPFSFIEFLDYKNELGEKPITANELKTELENYFDEYMAYGGFPIAISLKDHKEIILNDLYSSILLHDIVERHDIRNVGLFNRIVKFLIENIGNPISAHSVYNYLKHEISEISKPTIYNYLDYLEEAYVLSKASREDLIGKREITGSEKYYLMDLGFYKSQLEEKQQNTGHILENIVYLELLRQDYKVTIGKINESEIDFVCRKGNRKIYVQVCYLINEDEEIIKREFEPLSKIRDNYPKYVLSMEKSDYSRDGIEHVNIIRFLKNPDCLAS
ncbi:MAG: ATP-binding protein [Methanobrevibacter sp.]|nr:ATP-binding protein [Methanobrevibacter sp.]